MKKGLLGRNPIECLLLGRFDSFRSTTTTTRVNKRKRGKRKLHWSVLLLFSSRLVLYNKGQHWHPKCRRHWKQFDWSLLFVSFSLLRLSVVLYLSDDIVYSLCSEWSKKRKHWQWFCCWRVAIVDQGPPGTSACSTRCRQDLSDCYYSAASSLVEEDRRPNCQPPPPNHRVNSVSYILLFAICHFNCKHTTAARGTGYGGRPFIDRRVAPNCNCTCTYNTMQYNKKELDVWYWKRGREY